MCQAANNMMSIFACDRCLNVTPNFRCYNFRKRTVLDRLALIFPQLLNKFFVVLSVFLHICMQTFFRYCEKVRMDIECTDRET